MYRVVIVEDDPMVSLLDRTYTEKDARFQVVQTFQNGQAALEWLSVNPADLVILDVYMPLLTGHELLRELRMKTPDEIKRYQKIIANKDAILADAQAKADSMLEEAQIHTNELVSEHEIMQQAYAQANEIVTAATEQAQEILDNATSDANEIRIGAMRYADNLMANAEGIIGHTLDSYTTKYDSLVNSLQECYDMVRNNRAELDIPDQPAAAQNEDQGYEQEEEPAEDAFPDFDLDSEE